MTCPFWGGEVDCSINSWTLANGPWLGADVEGLAAWFVEHRMADGGWNCEWVEGSTRSSFHSTLNALRGLLAHEAATGGRRDACGSRWTCPRGRRRSGSPSTARGSCRGGMRRRPGARPSGTVAASEGTCANSDRQPGPGQPVALKSSRRCSLLPDQPSV